MCIQTDLVGTMHVFPACSQRLLSKGKLAYFTKLAWLEQKAHSDGYSECSARFLCIVRKTFVTIHLFCLHSMLNRFPKVPGLPRIPYLIKKDGNNLIGALVAKEWLALVK